MKKAIKVFIFIFATVLVICSSYFLYSTKSELDKKELLNYLSENTVRNGYNYSIKCEEDINNKHLILFTFNTKGVSDEQVGVGVFKITADEKYKFEKYIASNQSTGICPLITENEENHTLGYTVFYGTIINGYPLKHKIITSDKEFIEELKLGEYFLKYYPIKDDKGAKIVPINKS